MELSWEYWHQFNQNKTAKLCWHLLRTNVVTYVLLTSPIINSLLDQTYVVLESVLVGLLGLLCYGEFYFRHAWQTIEKSGWQIIHVELMGAILVWLILGNLVLTYSDRANRPRGKVSTTVLAFFSRWIWGWIWQSWPA